MKSRAPMTYEIAMAAARDAGNKSAEDGQRKKWNYEDYQVALDTFDQLWPPEDLYPVSPPEGSSGMKEAT